MMKDYLEEKGYPVPRSIAFSKIATEDVVRGNYLLVREETKKVKVLKILLKKPASWHIKIHFERI